MSEPKVKPANGSERPAAAIAGCGAISAVGSGVAALREALRTNASGLRPCPVFDSPRFQSAIAGAAPRTSEASDDDPAWFLADTALREARAAARDILSSV